MAKRLVIFDCDGVLFRSERANVAFYNEVLRRLGQPAMGDRDEAACHALASSQLFERLFAGRPELADRARAIAQALDYGPYYALMSPKQDLHEVLASLRGDYRLAMATNRGKTAAEVVRRFALDRYIELTVGVLDVARPKPHPDMLERCLVHFGFDPEAALYVGDQQIDADAAFSARVSFVAVGATVKSAANRIDSLGDLLTLVPSL
ncbi:MAG TPA: HAD-IA family hydrolase [Candidatus Binatia bacterium]|nr:HAD-IA family hydrolase [Candidatus Binatia bacterium]